MSNFNKRFVIIKAIIVLIAPIIVGLFPTERAFACSCVVSGTPEEEFKEFDAIFMGTVTSISERPAPDYLSEIDKAFYPKVKVGIKVGQSWKGVASDFIYVYTGYGDGDCGYSFTVDESYVIYAYGAADDLQTDICSRTAPASRAVEDVRYLDTLQPLFVASTPESTGKQQVNTMPRQVDTVLLLVSGSLLVVTVIWLLHRQRRAPL